MATGDTRTIDSDLTLTKKYEMTKYDDILNIIGATVTLSKPAGDLFTNEGNDTVTITNSTIKASASGLSFMLGSGDDTLNLQNSTIDAPILTGSGNDVVVITGDKQSKVTLKNQTDEEDITLNLGANDDILELQAILEGDGDISFGTGTDTLRFNSGSLLTTGTLGTFTNLDVMVAGGTLGRDLTLAGDNTQIILNGALFGSSAGKVINIADSTTTLTTADNIRTDVTLNLSNITLAQSEGGTLEFSGHTGYAITADNSTVTLHDIVTQAGNVFTGENTVWNVKDSDFANSTTGIDLTGGTIDLNNVEMSNYTGTAMKLSGTKLTGAQLAFTNNKGNSAILAEDTTIEIEELRMNGNTATSSNATSTATYRSSAAIFASADAIGGSISHISGAFIISQADFSGNIVAATAYSDATACANAYASSSTSYSSGVSASATALTSAIANAMGGGVFHSSGNLIISGAKFLENFATATALATATAAAYANATAYAPTYTTAYASASAFATVTASASASVMGGAIFHTSGNATIDDSNFSGNIAAVSVLACVSATALEYATATARAYDKYTSSCTSARAHANAYAAASAAYATALAIGGAISYTSGELSVSDTKFSKNIASASATASASTYATSCFSACSYARGGAIYAKESLINIKNTIFNDNMVIASAKSTTFSYGGALYLSQTTMNYTVTSGIKLSNTGNQAQYGGWLYMADNSTANLLIEDKAKLTIGDSTNNDSIAGTGLIQKQGTGYLLINSDISDYTGVWTVYEGTLELARIARTITLDNWTFGEKGLVILSNLDDTINMTANKKISTLDLGGGSDVINTNGYTLSNGELRVSKLKFTGGGVVSSTITNRSTDSGFDLTLDDVILNSDINGGNMADQILITNTSTLGGAITLGNGDNIITGTAAATFQKTLSAGSGNDTLSFSSVSFEDTVILGAGNDILSIGNSEDNSGSVTAKKTINLGDGDNSITSYGTAEFAGIIGGSSSDTIDLYKESSISGELDLGGGENVVYVEDTLTMNGAVKMTEGGETRIIVYRGTTLTDNSLTVYSDESAARDAVTMSWANQTELDKVRLVVSSDSTFETFEFAVELYNKSKSFTLNLEKGYFLQFQANDEDGWKQRLLDDTVAPNQVTGVEFNGRTLSWDIAHDNLGGNGVKQYTVEVATDSSFTTVIDTRTVTETEYVPQGLGDGTYYFRVCAEDYTKNIGEWSTTVSGKLDTVAPTRPTGGQSTVNGYNVTFSWNAATDTGSGVAEYEYRIASDSTYSTIVRSDMSEALTVTENDLAYGTYYWQVRAIDNAGNIGEWSLSKSVKTQDLIAPTTPLNVDYGVEESTVTVLWDGSQDDALGSGMKGYEIQLSNNSSFSSIVKSVSVTATEAVIANLAGGDYYMRVGAVDNAGNQSLWSDTLSFTIESPKPSAPTNLAGDSSGISWNGSAESYVAEYSADDYVHSLQISTTKTAVDTYGMNGNYDWRVRNGDSENWAEGIEITAVHAKTSQTLASDADGIGDLFFGNAAGTWGVGYTAQHLGTGSWQGTGEYAALAGKNKITDVFSGSTDANILVLTDDENGDALFVDDIYSAFPDEEQARLEQINEIRAGAGNDVVDLTSQRFDYTCGVTLRGGDGDDVLWANCGENKLFGDSGNDRIAGASGNDVIAGGAGNDTLNGGGGADIFCFCSDWGTDTVEQLSDGSVTLWFAAKGGTWNQETLTYTEGDNSVTVKGALDITLKFGDDESAQYDTLVSAGAFDGCSSYRIFEEQNKGKIAVL